MVFICLTSICLIVVFLILIFHDKFFEKSKSISFKLLPEYISSFYKKRKTNTKTSKKQHQNTNIPSFFVKNKKNLRKNKISYQKLERSFLSFEMSKFEGKNLTFVEQNNLKFSKTLKSLSKDIDEKINSNTQKYRTINNQCLIETVATSFANATITETEFNMFSSFKKICSLVKIYKKEAEILNVLVIAKLIKLYCVLQNEIQKIKQQVLSAKKIKRLNKKSSPEKIYGVYLFNKSALKILLKSEHNVANATNNVLQKLDEIQNKQTIIFRYVRLLSGVK